MVQGREGQCPGAATLRGPGERLTDTCWLRPCRASCTTSLQPLGEGCAGVDQAKRETSSKLTFSSE